MILDYGLDATQLNLTLIKLNYTERISVPMMIDRRCSIETFFYD